MPNSFALNNNRSKYEDLGRLLSLYRTRARFTQLQLAGRLGVSEKSVRNWEHGLAYPSADHLKKLVELYLQHRVFTTGQELAEAAELWEKSRLNSAFDQLWFMSCLKKQQAPLRSVPPASIPSGQSGFVPLTPFIGRTQELPQLLELLRQPAIRLVTIAGPGGAGKTRLAYEAARLAGDFVHRIHFVELAGITDPDLFVPALVRALGLRDDSRESNFGSLLPYFKEKSLLLVLDNFEQLLPAASLLPQFLAAAPNLKLLVTSRAVLRLRGEIEFNLAGLALPSPSGDEADQTARPGEALEFALDRYRALNPAGSLSPADQKALAALCIRLDGIPLAIELAVARLKLFSPLELLGRLDQGLPLLSTRQADFSVRHQSLLATMDWSYNLLNPDQQRLFRRLGIFRGSWTLEAASQVANLDQWPFPEIVDLLEQLADQSLVQPLRAANGKQRFKMLEIVREYAVNRLAQSGEVARLGEEHLAYYLKLTGHDRNDPELSVSATLRVLLEPEMDNLRAALDFALEQGRTLSALQLTANLGRYWFQTGGLSEGRKWLGQALALAEGEPGLLVERARCLNAAALLAWAQSDFKAAVRDSEAVLARLPVSFAAERASALLLQGMAIFEQEAADYAQARALMEAALEGFSTAEHPSGQARTLLNLARVALHCREFEEATRQARQSVELFEELGDKWGVAVNQKTLAAVALLQGDYGLARRQIEPSLAYFRQAKDKTFLTSTLMDAAMVLSGCRETEAAFQLALEGFELCLELGNLRTMVDCLNILASLVGRLGYPYLGVRLAGAAHATGQKLNYPIPLAYLAIYEKMLARLRQRLPLQEFEQAWATGSRLDLAALHAEILQIKLADSSP